MLITSSKKNQKKVDLQLDSSDILIILKFIMERKEFNRRDIPHPFYYFQIRQMMESLITLLIDIKDTYNYCYKINTSSTPDLIKH